MEPGLGKTAVALSALTPEHLPALVIAPKRVAVRVWPKEASIWRPDLDIAVAVGPPAKRQRLLASKADIITVTQDSIKDVPEKHKFRTVIIDESHNFKSRDTQRWRIGRKITKRAEHVWLLTGTPTGNSSMDLWAQAYLLDNGERLGVEIAGKKNTGIVAFRHRYFSPALILDSGVVAKWEPKPGADQRIVQLVSDICLSMKAEDYLDMPDLFTNKVEVDMPAVAQRAYEGLRDELVADLEILGSTIHTAANSAVLTNRLSQVTAGFLYGDETKAVTRLHRAKLDALQGIAEEAGSPLLVAYRFVEEAKMIREAFPDARGVDDRGALDDWDRGRVPMLLAHPQAAGAGLNLQAGGHHIVWTSPIWSMIDYQQFNGRLYRQGQGHPVIVHHLMAEKVDREALKVVQGKKRLLDAVLDTLGADPEDYEGEAA
jgi:SNF2 family DNA or RNA helicase